MRSGNNVTLTFKQILIYLFISFLISDPSDSPQKTEESPNTEEDDVNRQGLGYSSEAGDSTKSSNPIQLVSGGTATKESGRLLSV